MDEDEAAYIGGLLAVFGMVKMPCTLCGGYEVMPTAIAQMFVQALRQQSGLLVDLTGQGGRFGGFVCSDCAEELGGRNQVYGRG